MRELTEKDVEFRVICRREFAPIHGNCSAVDPETDRKTERRIERQLENGNEWAWCTVEVKAVWEGLEASDYLGCCSYKSEKDFRKGGYFEDMKAEALRCLNEQVGRLAQAIKELR